MNEYVLVKPKVERTKSGLWSWKCDCSLSGLLGHHDQQGTFRKAWDHARQYHGHTIFEYFGGGWWLRTCKLCPFPQWGEGVSLNHERERALKKADEHYRRYHQC